MSTEQKSGPSTPGDSSTVESLNTTSTSDGFVFMGSE